MSIETDTLVDAFQDSVGSGRAETIVDQACSEAGLGSKRRLSQDEALEVAETVTKLDDVGTFAQISANTLKTRIRTEDLGS